MDFLSSWLEPAGRRYIYILLSVPLLSYTSNLVFEILRLHPIDPVDYKSVSPAFGLGTYLAWWVTATSVLIRGPSEDAEGHSGSIIVTVRNANWTINADLLTAVGYVAAVAVWSIVLAVRQEYAELEAGLVVLEAAADLCMIHVITTTDTNFTRLVATSLLALSIMVHGASPIPELQSGALHTSVAAATRAASIFGTVAAKFAASVETPSHSRQARSTASSTASTSPNYGLTVLITIFTVAFVAEVMRSADFPLKGSRRMGVTAFCLAALWVSHFANFGTYAIMPYTEVDIVSFDQLAPLGVAILIVGWDWIPKIKDFVEERIMTTLKNRVRRIWIRLFAPRRGQV